MSEVVITTTLQGCNKLGISKWERKFSDTNFEIGKPCWHFDWMLQSSSGQKTKAFSQNVCTVFWSQSWYQRTLLSISAGANREAITRNFYMGILKTIIPLPSLSSHSSLSALGILLEITVCLFKMEDMLSSHSVGHIPTLSCYSTTYSGIWNTMNVKGKHLFPKCFPECNTMWRSSGVTVSPLCLNIW